MRQWNRRLVIGLGLALALSGPASSSELITGPKIRLRWQPPAGEVHHYGVWLGTPATGFTTKPVYTTKDPQVQIPAVFLGRLQVRVAAFDGKGRRGPFSPISDAFRFAEAAEAAEKMTCQQSQLRALGQLCKAQLQCEAQSLEKGPDAREGCLSAAAFDFGVRYESVRSRSDCQLDRPADRIIQTFQHDTQAMREAIERDPEAVALLMGASRMCRRGFVASRRLPSVLDTDERTKTRGRVRDRFVDRSTRLTKGREDTATVATMIDGAIDHWFELSRPSAVAFRIAEVETYLEDD